MGKVVRKSDESTHVIINLDLFDTKSDYLILSHFGGKSIDLALSDVKNNPLFCLKFKGLTCADMLEFENNDGMIIRIDTMNVDSRRHIRIFEWIESDTFDEIDWYDVKTCPFDSSFFTVGHPYLVKMDRNEEMKYMLLIEKEFDHLTFLYGNNGVSYRYDVPDTKYRNQKKEYWYRSVLTEDVWSDKDEKTENEGVE